MPQEKDEAGNIWEVDAQGNPVALVTAAQQQGQVFTLPTDPAEQARIEMERQRLIIAQQGAGNAASMQPLREDLLRAQIAKAEADAAKAAQGTAGAATGNAKTQARTANLDALVQQINRVQQLYEAGPGATDGIGSIQDYLPIPQNRQFNSAAAGLAEQGLAAFRVPGVGAQSDTELRQFVEANKPAASDYDLSIEEKLRQLRLRVDANRQSMGLPAAEWVAQDDRPNAMTMPRIVNGGGPGAADFGATTQGLPLPPEYQAQYERFVRQGNFTPQQYAQFRNSLDQQYGFAPTTDYMAEGQRIADQLQAGGTLNLTIPPVEAPLEGLDRLRNSAVSNPIGAAAVGALDMGGFGGVTALAGDQMAALGDANPLAMALGQIGGAITGTGMVARGAREAAKRLAPATLGGGGGAQFGRNLATDMAYSGIYGGVSGNGAAESAAEGGLGSIVGQGLGKGLGKVVSGASLAPAVQALQARGIPMTVGQKLGGFAKSVEDAMTSLPGAGTMVGNRRLEGLRAFNQAAFDDAGRPIGASVRNIGEEGVQSLLEQAGNAYDNSTSGANVPLDGPFWADMAQVAAKSRMLPDDLATRFVAAMDNRMAPVAQAGNMTGEQYQQAFRGLKGYRAETTKPGFEQDYRDTLTGAMDALTGAMQRGGGQDVVTGLANADTAYRGAKTLQKAVTAARNGGRSGEIQTFAPSQLNDAATQAANKYGGGRQFADLIDAGQQVLPSQIPDSGTAGRLAVQGAVGAGALGGAGALDYANGELNALQKTAMTIALLTAGGTRGGQKALDALLIRRPDAVRKVGNAISRKGGIFGAATLPFAITN